jgi:hypothetical protein
MFLGLKVPFTHGETLAFVKLCSITVTSTVNPIMDRSQMDLEKLPLRYSSSETVFVKQFTKMILWGFLLDEVQYLLTSFQIQRVPLLS